MTNCGPGSRQESRNRRRTTPDDSPKRRPSPEQTPAIQRSSRGRASRRVTMVFSFTGGGLVSTVGAAQPASLSPETEMGGPVPVRVTRTRRTRAVNLRPTTDPGQGGDGSVTLAVLSAGSGNALDPSEAGGLADDLVAALRAAGASEVERLGDPAALRTLYRRAHDANQRVLICADNLVAHGSLLRMLATEPGGRSTALVVADPAGD